jgi:transcription elongation GreA/GreB family factor
MLTADTKAELLRLIIEKLNHDLALFFNAAKTAHEAAIDEENQPDNKYDTTALEASYLAQGQANRAQELRRSIEIYKQLLPPPTGDTIQITSLVSLEDENGSRKLVFIGPLEGGLKINTEAADVMVITPASPLGKSLIGKSADDSVEITSGGPRCSYQIIEFI